MSEIPVEQGCIERYRTLRIFRMDLEMHYA